MRVLLAVNHEGIEEYISFLPGIDIVNTLKDKTSLLDYAGRDIYELAVIANELSGSENMRDIMGAFTANKSLAQRIIFLYGEYDGECDDFINYLKSRGVYDIFVGTEITSDTIKKLIFSPSKNECPYICREQRTGKEERRYFKNVNPVGKSVIAVLSNQATGKSHTAWNLGYCFSKLGCSTSILNLDRGYSANLYWGIDEIYHDLLSFTITYENHREILKNCFKIKNLNIITGRLGDETEICADDFIKILYNVRTKSEVTIIDTRTGISDVTRQAIRNSSLDLLIFDCDIMHYHMNMLMIDNLKDDFIPEKTIAVINNTNIKSPSHKFIYNELVGTGLAFKDILPISSCGQLSYEMMHTKRTPYQADDERRRDFARDMDNLLNAMTLRIVRDRKLAGIFSE